MFYAFEDLLARGDTEMCSHSSLHVSNSPKMHISIS